MLQRSERENPRKLVALHRITNDAEYAYQQHDAYSVSVSDEVNWMWACNRTSISLSPMGPPNGPYTQMQSNTYGIPAANPLHPPGYVQTSIPGHQQAHYFGGLQMQTYSTYMGPSYNWHPHYGQQLQLGQMTFCLPAYPMQPAGQQLVLTHPTHQTPDPGTQLTFAPSASNAHTATNPRLMTKENVNAKTVSNNEQLRRFSEPVVSQHDMILNDTKKPQTVSFSKKRKYFPERD